MTRQKWTEVEDLALMETMKACAGITNWETIANNLATLGVDKKPHQVRSRWVYNLLPGINKAEWSEEESQKLFDAYERTGDKWNVIKDSFDGRTDIAVKNQFFSVVRRGLRMAVRLVGKKCQESYTKLINSIKPKVLATFVSCQNKEEARMFGYEQKLSAMAFFRKYLMTENKKRNKIYSETEKMMIEAWIDELVQLNNIYVATRVEKPADTEKAADIDISCLVDINCETVKSDVDNSNTPTRSQINSPYKESAGSDLISEIDNAASATILQEVTASPQKQFADFVADTPSRRVSGAPMPSIQLANCLLNEINCIVDSALKVDESMFKKLKKASNKDGKKQLKSRIKAAQRKERRSSYMNSLKLLVNQDTMDAEPSSINDSVPCIKEKIRARAKTTWFDDLSPIKPYEDRFDDDEADEKSHENIIDNIFVPDFQPSFFDNSDDCDAGDATKSMFEHNSEFKLSSSLLLFDGCDEDLDKSIALEGNMLLTDLIVSPYCHN